jgi:hypothetical protein
MKTRLVLLAALASALPALAYIEGALTTLTGVIKESDVVVRGTIDAVSIEKKLLILKVGKPVKGKTVYEKIRLDLGAGESWHPEAALRHAVAGTPVAIFYKKAEGSDQAALALIYLNRFFLMARGEESVWRFSKIETGMNKVWLGTPAELADLVGKIHAGRAKAPEPAAQLKPWTKEALDALPPPPKEGEPWPPFESSK